MLKTKNGRSIDVEELTLSDVVDEISSIDSDLATALDALAHNCSDLTFYKASYQFGSKIISNNNCYLPLSNGESISFNDKDLPDSLLADLYFNPDTEDPLGMVLNKTSEFYLFNSGIIQPYSLIGRGQMFGIPRAVYNDIKDIPTAAVNLNLNAGARSLFMLSSIGDQYHHSKLQAHYGIKLDAPTSLAGHWNVFVDLARKASSPWRCEIIYLPRKWIDKLKTPEWAIITNCLLKLQRMSYNIWHNGARVWETTFQNIERQKKLHSYPMNSLNIAKQLFMLAGNSAVGYRPAQDEDAAPISLLQNAYANMYSLKQRAIIMEPAKFDIQIGIQVYHSINYPNISYENLEASRKKSQIKLLEELRWLHVFYMRYILEDCDINARVNAKSLYDITAAASFSFFHPDGEKYPHINDAGLIPDSDPRFGQNQSGEFPKNSPFFKGCIKISRKD